MTVPITSTRQEPVLLIVLIEIIAGHLLGKFVPNRWHAYLLSAPLGVAIYVSLLVLLPLPAGAASGNEPAWALVGGLLCVPVAAFGVFLGHRSGRRRTS
jgi:uncharacterized membrane protein YdcZ (DUF606 family)